MIRIALWLAALGLLILPVWMLSNTLVPVPRYRTGGYADYHGLVVALGGLYGGAVLGIVVRCGWLARRRPALPRDVFRGGWSGVMAVAVVTLLMFGVRGALTKGSFAAGLGNLWGLSLILAAMYGAMVAAGAALAWRAARGR